MTTCFTPSLKRTHHHHHSKRMVAVLPITDSEESAFERLSNAKSQHSRRSSIEAQLVEFERRRLAQWLEKFGKVGFVTDTDSDGVRPKEIFDAADSRLKALVSLGVMAGLLAGTAVSTISLASNNLLGDWVYALSLCSSICSISTALLISYHYFNGAKLLSLGHLTVEFFSVRTEVVKEMCVRCFFVATITQSVAFFLITIEKAIDARDSLVRALPFLLVMIFSIGIFRASLKDMLKDREEYRRCKRLVQQTRTQHHHHHQDPIIHEGDHEDHDGDDAEDIDNIREEDEETGMGLPSPKGLTRNDSDSPSDAVHDHEPARQGQETELTKPQGRLMADKTVDDEQYRKLRRQVKK